MSVFLAYHYPCLDGAYSLLMSFLFFRETQKSGISAQDLIDYISQYDAYDSINKSIFEHLSSSKSSQKDEESKNDYNPESYNDYSPMVIKDVIYVPTRLNADGKFLFPYNKYSPDFLKKSVIFFMDYNGTHAATILDVASKFQKLIVIDHHLTFEHVISELQKADCVPNNLLFLYRKENSGASLALEFFEKIKGSPILADKEKYARLIEVVKYVEDNDIKAGKVKNSEEFTCGILKRRMNFNPYENYDLFQDLTEVNIEIVIELGAIEFKNRLIKTKQIVKNKHKVYLGGKTKESQGKFGVCYGVLIEEQELRNEVFQRHFSSNYLKVCHELAVLSIKDGLENIGFGYSQVKYGNKFKISVRSVKGESGGDCEAIARGYNGGGHYNAAGFFLKESEFRRWV